MTVPAELIDNILSFLQSDIDTLKVCSGSHPILHQLVERHLYTNITIQDRVQVGVDHDDFPGVLRKCPDIVKYVQSLDINFGQGSDPEDFLEDVSLILPKLTALRKIGFTYTKRPTYLWPSGTAGLYTTPTFSWTIPPKFRFAFQDCLRLPSLTHISIENFPFPLSTLSHCRHIKNLSLRGWCFDGEVVDTTRLPTIDSLTLHKCRPDSLSIIAGWIQSHRISSLEFSNFDYSYHSVTIRYLHDILRCCSHSVTSLDLDIGRLCNSYYYYDKSTTVCYPSDAIPIPLSITLNLQRLTIRAELDTINFRTSDDIKSWGFWSPIPAITSILKPAFYVKCLTLVFYSSVQTHFDRYHKYMFTDIFLTPLRSLLLRSASSTDSIKLQINSTQVTDPLSVSPEVILSLLTDHPNLTQSVENDTFILTPTRVADDPTAGFNLA